MESLSGYGDQISVKLVSEPLPGLPLSNTARYRVSSCSLEPMYFRYSTTLCSDVGRVLGNANKEMAWYDLLSDEKGGLTFAEGLSVVSSKMFGSAGGRAFVADIGKGVLGAYDWQAGKWLTPHAMPADLLQKPEGQKQKDSGWPSAGGNQSVVGDGDHLFCLHGTPSSTLIRKRG